MDANARDLAQVFSRSCRYVVPLFQRPYVWQQDSEWEPLWGDVRAVVERKLAGEDPPPHFLGAVVLEQLNTATGALEARQVIDGQQRLTTLQVLLVALRDVCAASGGGKHVSALEKLIVNDDPYLDDEDHRFKVWPTNVDRDAYRAVMTVGDPVMLRKHFDVGSDATYVGHRLGDAYLYFHRTISEWLGEQTEDREEVLKAVVMSLRGSLRFVVIDLDREDDPQVIFETLNARGTPLLAADLVKNYLFHIAERRREDVERLYNKYWRSFDRESAFWREEVRQGRLKHPRINVFLQHYLTLRLKREVPAAQTFLAFRGMAAETSSAEPLMEEMARYGAIYRGMHEWPHDSPEGVFFYRLGLIDTSTVIPFLMEVFAVLGTKDLEAERRAVLRTLESFLVRRLVCGMTFKNYNRLFVDLLTWTQAQGISAASVRGFLLSGDGPSVRWPTDEEFGRAWTLDPLYKTLVRRRLRMILEAIDLRLRSDLTEQVHLPTKLTIEHVLPQSWEKNWPLPETADIEERLALRAGRSAAVHRIGNLTLLTKKLNPALSNSAWAKKREEITRHSALNMNRHFHDVEQWNEDAIERRSHLLLRQAQAIWAHPRSGERSEVHESVSQTPEPSDEDTLVERVRENLREIVAELAGPEPVDFVESFAVLYADDVEALDDQFKKTPGFGGREFLMQELASILRSDPTVRFDPEHGGYVRRAPQAAG
ncbi:MAG: DUF262 domain-containing protein [Myxococcales bacterium]|nr:DUF262 domain-containing protein [Myxococcales bacterium]